MATTEQHPRAQSIVDRQPSADDVTITGLGPPPNPPRLLRYCGLVNLRSNTCGSTCYMNANLQALYFTNKARRYLLQKSIRGRLTAELRNLYQKMVVSALVPSEGKYYFPYTRPIKMLGEVRSLMPSYNKPPSEITLSAQSFLLDLLGVLHAEHNKPIAPPPELSEPDTGDQAWLLHVTYKDNSPFAQMFMGQFEIKSRCDCGYEHYGWEVFWALKLDPKAPLTRTNEEVDPITVVNCIREFEREKSLPEHTCPQCNRRGRLTQRTTIRKAPVYLLILLERFTPDRTLATRGVHFNHHLKLAERSYAFNSGVMYEQGENLRVGAGHYTCLYFEGSDRWVLIDDEGVNVLICNESGVYMMKNFGLIGIYRSILPSSARDGRDSGRVTN